MNEPGRVGPRIERERGTVQAMIHLYCRDRHASSEELCSDCKELFDYAWTRLGYCPHGDAKPTCAQCPIHCYKPDFREKITTVMRYAGPKMLFRHPLIALRHLMDGRRSAKLVAARKRQGNPVP